MITTQTLFQNDLTTPIGQIRLAGAVSKGARSDRGQSFVRMRVLGSYALVLLLEGTGAYSDASHSRRRIEAGDLLLLFPELAHSYGPERWDTWGELFIVFDGAVFDLWRERGLLSSERPVRRLSRIGAWGERLLSYLADRKAADSDVAARVGDVCRFLEILADVLSASSEPAGESGTHPWLDRAKSLLESDLGRRVAPADVAAELDVSYETFRKEFRKATGLSPARYRRQKRIAVAGSLMQHTQLTNKQMSESLGFADPFHFAKCFRAAMGATPRQFRRRGAQASSNTAPTGR